MLSFLKKIFGSKPAETPVPYKVETPKVEQFPFPSQPAEKPTQAAKPKAEKKPVVKAKTARKPRFPKA
jgi:hypothetical protein